MDDLCRILVPAGIDVRHDRYPQGVPCNVLERCGQLRVCRLHQFRVKRTGHFQRNHSGTRLGLYQLSDCLDPRALARDNDVGRAQ